MPFQTVVSNDIAWGIPGEYALADFGGRAEPFHLGELFTPAEDSGAIFGRAVTRDFADSDAGSYQVGNIGGAGVFMGLLTNPKQSCVGVGLGATFENLQPGTVLECTSQHAGVWVELVTAGNVGDGVAFAADGRLSAAPAQVAPDSTTLIPGARIVRFDVAAGLAIVALQQLPVPATA